MNDATNTTEKGNEMSTTTVTRKQYTEAEMKGYMLISEDGLKSNPSLDPATFQEMDGTIIEISCKFRKPISLDEQIHNPGGILELVV